ncbi:condensation domain-containing protein, partial [Francisella sp. SYW-9]|uniref:condensation domain-containing protein n=1 Tax=Francisella sp. SYW-9 TaxID=2610888 RepID=UPI00123D59BD
MSIIDFFEYLRLHGGAIWFNDKLYIDMPRDLTSLENKQYISLNKDNIVNLLYANDINSPKKFIENKILKLEVDIYPLSFAQERLWFIEQYEGGSNAYHIPMLVSLKEGVNEEALKQSILSIVSRHEVLRSVFRQDNEGNDYQVVLNDSLVINEYSYKDIGISKQIDKDINTPFD